MIPVRRENLGGLGWWSLPRDKACRRVAEVLYASTERVTNSNAKGAKSTGRIASPPRSTGPVFPAPASCCVLNTKGDRVPFRIPPFYLPQPLAATPAWSPVSREPGRSTQPPHAALCRVWARVGRDSGPRVWGMGRIYIMHGEMPAWVEGVMHSRGDHTGSY